MTRYPRPERTPPPSFGPPTLAQHLVALETEHDEWLDALPEDAWHDNGRGSEELSPQYELEQLCRFPWFGPDDDRLPYIVAGIVCQSDG